MNDALLDLLKQLADQAPEFCFINEVEAEELKSYDAVEFSKEHERTAMQIAVRITDEGLIAIGYKKKEVAAQAPAPVVPLPVISETAPIPEAEDIIALDVHKGDISFFKRGARKRNDLYPFGRLHEGELFFVEATEERPNPTRTLTSTAASASKRYAKIDGMKKAVRKGVEKDVPNYVYDRKFAVATVKEGEICGDFTAPADGAIVMRIPVS